MAHVQVKKAEGEWREVRGTASKFPGGVGLYRIVITDDLDFFDGVAIEALKLRVNGLEMRDLAWVLPPAATTSRGYVSIQAEML